MDEDWMGWTLTDGTDCLIPAYIDVRRDAEDWILYHGHPRKAVGIQKPGMFYFDQTYWPYLDGVPDSLSNLSDAVESMMWSIPTPPNQSAMPTVDLANGAKNLRASTDAMGATTNAPLRIAVYVTNRAWKRG